MRRRGPLLTLLAGLALAGLLGTLSMNATKATKDARPADASGVARPPAGEPGAGGEPEAGPEPGAGGEPDAGPEPGAGAAPAVNLNVTWAGRTKGGKATVAITAKGDRAIAYVCDGERIEAWLAGTAANGRLDLAAPAKAGVDAELTGAFGSGRARGTFSVDGEEFAFNIGTVRKPSGLYRATADVRGAVLVGGWIALADGTQVGLATFAGSTVPVAPLDLASRTTTAYGETITAAEADPGAAP